MSNELLQKVIDTTDMGNSTSDNRGLLYPEQSNRFIDYMWDATVLTKAARTIRMKSDTVEIDKVNVGQRILRAANQALPRNYAVGDSGYPIVNSDAYFSKVSLTTKKLRLDWELSSETLEDNIEGTDLEDHIARMMATQAGNDVEDLLIAGDTASSDSLLVAFDGFSKQAKAGGYVVNAYNSTLGMGVFNQAIKALPRKYKQRRNQLRFFTSSNLVQDYLYNLAINTNSSNFGTPFDIASGVIRGDVAANDGGPGTITPFAFGIPVINVPLMPESTTTGELHLTFPQNFIVGIKRDITVYRTFQPKKDTIEYTLYIRVGCAIENLDAHVVVTNIGLANVAGTQTTQTTSTVSNSYALASPTSNTKWVSTSSV
jgi:hypothetical protein